MKRNYVLEQWDIFATQVLKVNMAQEERNLRKQMFYAGCTALLAMLNDHGVPNLRILPQIADELIEWSHTQQRIAENEQAAALLDPQKQKPPVDVAQMRQIEKMARDAFRALDEGLDGVLNRREIGAALFLFSFTGSELTYISNAMRSDMLKMLREFLMANPPELTWDAQHG